MSELMSDQLRAYVDSLVPPRPAELQLMEEDARTTGFPIIGPAAGQFCYQVTRLLGARRVFEMGSGYGYSTAWFARGVVENGGGTVHHVVWDAALTRRAQHHLGRLGYDGTIEYHTGEAIEALRAMAGGFDIIFNDIDKQSYPESLDVIRRRLRPGGVLIVDNMLWSGRIFDDADDAATTAGVRELTRRLTADPDWTVSLVPIRDGLVLARLL